eukprot:437626_1
MESSTRLRVRMMKELKIMERDPPSGISVWSSGDRLDHFKACIAGPADSPYEGGNFKLDVRIPDRYPFQPPNVRFVTVIYHPNIDDGGRICLDTLKMPPKGAWTPSLNIVTVLTMIQQLMAYPNPDDGLVAHITNQYKIDKASFLIDAKNITEKYAMKDIIAVSSNETISHKTPETAQSIPVPTSTAQILPPKEMNTFENEASSNHSNVRKSANLFGGDSESDTENDDPVDSSSDDEDNFPVRKRPKLD